MKTNSDKISIYINRALDLAITESASKAIEMERQRIKLELKAAQLDRTNLIPLEDVLNIVDHSLELQS